MGLAPLLSFASGELDPILTDNVTLDKFRKGLATARNVGISKTGSVLSRFSRQHIFNAKVANKAIKIYVPKNTNYLLEFGDLYVRVHIVDPDTFGITSVADVVSPFAEDDLPSLHFDTSKDYVYIFLAGEKMAKFHLALSGSAFLLDADVFRVFDPIDTVGVVVTGSTGYSVDYLATLVRNGEESIYKEITTGFNKPIAAGQSNLISVAWTDADVDMDEFNEVRIYSRPNNGGAYGLLGTTTKTTLVGATRTATFRDIGSLPDFANGIQDLVTKYGLNGSEVIDLQPKTGIVYQQRLILCGPESDEEAVIASRPGFQNNFYRDFPYAVDSALVFKAGTSGRAKVLRAIEHDGLILFTTNGVYTSTGVLTNPVALERRGGWIIKEDVPPLVVPGGVFFVDESNTIRQLIFSQDIGAYESIEQTIFSNHLFKTRTIKSWAFQKGNVPQILVTFSDGKFGMFTYIYEHQMKAWTRGDSVYPVEQVEGCNSPDRSFWVVNKNGTRSIEMSLPRYVPTDEIASNPESDMLAPNMLADSIQIAGNILPVDGVSGPIMSPVVPLEWDGQIQLEYADQGVAPFIVDETIRWFHPVDKNAIDLKVISSTNIRTVFQPTEEFPAVYALEPRLYRTYATISTGLTHLEGESVSIMVDGSLVASPFNDDDVTPAVLVTGGSITLPNNLRGAIILIGRPIVADMKTLNISTVEQSSTLIESINVNKLYVRVNETRGLYCSNQFPEEKNDEKDGHSVKGMEDLGVDLVPAGEAELIGNRFLPPVSKRIEKTVPGHWNSQGQIAFRQVDPFHFEILSVIPDVTVQTRSDR